METNGQVKLSKFIFSHNWEDPLMDERALQLKEGQVVFTITSGGCNTLGFLRFQPSSIFCVDINAAQTYVMELKQAAFRRLDYENFVGFIGIRKCADRLKLFDQLKNDLSKEAREFWEGKRNIIRKGIFMNGRYESFVRFAGWVMRSLQGPSRTRRLFALGSLGKQREFFDSEWNNRKWKFIFETLFNKKRLANKGLNADYFHFDDGSSSFSESFQRRAAHALTDLPAKSNYFLSLYLLGKYQDELHMPEYLKEENYAVIKKNIDCVRPITADSKYWLAEQRNNFFDAFALSNICELMDANDTLKLFEEVVRTAKPGAKVIFRNLMIPRDVPESLQGIIIKNEELSKELQQADRSFVYGKVAAYEVRK